MVNSLLLVIYMIIETCISQDIIDVAETLYFRDEVSASNDANQALNYFVSLCPIGLIDDNIAVLDIYLPQNVNWKPSEGYPVLQISECENSFTEQCVIAANYFWHDTGPEAVSSISWKINATRNSTNYYIRVMSMNQASIISVEISFANNINATSYPWTSDYPFATSGMTTTPQPLAQYWKTTAVYSVNNLQQQVFKIGYCPQGNAVNEVDIAVAAIPDPNDYSLMQTWACPATATVAQCQYSYAQSGHGWLNPKIGSFAFLTCKEGLPVTTKKGLWVVVKGWGANKNEINKFTFMASIKS